MKGQITLEFIVMLTLYTLILAGILTLHRGIRDKTERANSKIDRYSDIERTAEACSYKYFHGPSVNLKRNCTAPEKIEGSKLKLGKEKTEVSATTFSSSIQSSSEGVKCGSTKPWYLKKDR